MRCIACDKRLTDYESSMKDAAGRYLDMCRKCHSFIQDDVPAVGNFQLLHQSDDDGVDEEAEVGYNSSTENEDN